MPPHSLSSGAIVKIITGKTDDIGKPVLQLLSAKCMPSASGSADRYRVLISDGLHSYSHVMLATQLNDLMVSGEMDNLSVFRVERFFTNTTQGDRQVLVLMEVTVLARGTDVGDKIGNPQQYKPGDENVMVNNNVESPPKVQKPVPPISSMPARATGPPAPYGNRQQNGPATPHNKASGGAPGTPGGTGRVHSISSLTPYQNRWRIRARVTSKSSIRTWSNSRGEGKLFSVNFLDESGEIRATGFNDAVDKFYDRLEINKVYYVSRGTLKTANKQYTTVDNDYEMTFNSDTQIEDCLEDVDLPTVTFNFIKISELAEKEANSMIDIMGVVKTASEVGTVVGRQSNREIKKRDLTIVDQSEMSVSLTLWGNDAESFENKGNPVLAIKGARVSDFGGRSVSCLASSNMIINPDTHEAHLLRGWYERDGYKLDFAAQKNDGVGGSGGFTTNWKSFSQVKTEGLGNGEKPDYFSTKATVLFLRKENCMYTACPTETCNKKLVDQGNGLYRCEKCQREFPNFKWRMILSANLADYSDNQWVTCFQESAEILLGVSADELGQMKETNEAAFDQVFQEAMFKSYIFKFRAKMESYNDESRLKTICMNAGAINWSEYGQRLTEEIDQMQQQAK